MPCTISSAQAIQQEGIPSTESDVGRITARLRDKGQDYGDFWGARSTGSSSRLEELTWFIRYIDSGFSRVGYRVLLRATFVLRLECQGLCARV